MTMPYNLEGLKHEQDWVQYVIECQHKRGEKLDDDYRDLAYDIDFAAEAASQLLQEATMYSSRTIRQTHGSCFDMANLQQRILKEIGVETTLLKQLQHNTHGFLAMSIGEGQDEELLIIDSTWQQYLPGAAREFARDNYPETLIVPVDQLEETLEYYGVAENYFKIWLHAKPSEFKQEALSRPVRRIFEFQGWI